MEPIRTTSGKTARANLADMRQRRVAVHKDQTDVLIEQLDALALQAYATIRAIGEQGNLLRLLAIDARKLTKALRKARSVDVQL